ncbi:hypothetical protein CEXT_773461 [Caerostris extrusa]|uniref:Uncharacterized protein n=1 Tax=Caerostris extrusa TaxID=172846 RepID=A0AAV4PBP5_CAEEX|nr:hypothetical protein CEXT_773461 [Caerostris extrusa]
MQPFSSTTLCAPLSTKTRLFGRKECIIKQLGRILRMMTSFSQYFKTEMSKNSSLVSGKKLFAVSKQSADQECRKDKIDKVRDFILVSY